VRAETLVPAGAPAMSELSLQLPAVHPLASPGDSVLHPDGTVVLATGYRTLEPPGQAIRTSVDPVGDIFVTEILPDGDLLWDLTLDGERYNEVRAVATDNVGAIVPLGVGWRDARAEPFLMRIERRR